MLIKNHRICLFFIGWALLAVTSVTLSTLNIEWEKTPVWQGVLVLLVMAVIQSSVLELVVITMATLLLRGKRNYDEKASSDNSTLLLNYNLLALSREDVEETYRRMYAAYMGNLQPNVTAVLVSATNDVELQLYELKLRDDYRVLLYATLLREGESFAAKTYGEIDRFRLVHVWQELRHLEGGPLNSERLREVAAAYAADFMCVHRVSRVLRKCGQYQDLMLLSAGQSTAFTYTDTALYRTKRRLPDEPLFQPSADVENLQGRGFHYTLVLDGDTKVPEGAALELLAVAAAHPEAAIIQPAILMDVDPAADTLFMLLERLRQQLHEPTTGALAAVLGHSGFYGKGLLKNTAYIYHVIGTRSRPVERVPIDVLSHDTFEAAVLPTYFASTVGLLEAPCLNYVSWDIRERRWNKGEVVLSIYFWPWLVGAPMRFLQRLVHGKHYVPTRLRTPSSLGFVHAYVAHSALRQMWMKPLLLLFILLHLNIELKFPYVPLVIMMFLILIFPKFAICTRKNLPYVLVETLGSIMQFTPEAVVGVVRMLLAYQGAICRLCNWKPQMAVEEEIRRSNPLLSSLRHLWGYSAFALLAGAVIAVFAPCNMLIYIMLGTLFLLPFFTAFTSLTPRLRCPRNHSRLYRDNFTISTNAVYSVNSWTEYKHKI